MRTIWPVGWEAKMARRWCLHGDIVRDDGLLLKLKLLEDIWLENLLDLCRWESQSHARIDPRLFVEEACICPLTEVPEVVGAQHQGQSSRVRNPFPLDNQGPRDEKDGRDIDIVDVVARQQRVLGVGSHGAWSI